MSDMNERTGPTGECNSDLAAPPASEVASSPEAIAFQQFQEHRAAIIQNLVNLIPVDFAIKNLVSRALEATEEDLEIVAAARAALDAVLHEQPPPF